MADFINFDEKEPRKELSKVPVSYIVVRLYEGTEQS